jgi:hydroxymethylpyrimidine pyrophosphatase-like HAD family hydrolase
MRAVIGVDLDQTMIYSERTAVPLDGAPTVWVEDYLDAPLSMMTVIAHQQLADLAARHHVIPVTTRTPEQFHRVRLPLDEGYAICCNGGILLQQGIRDLDWDRRVRIELESHAPASQIAARIALIEREPWVRLTRQVEDLFVYVVAESRGEIPTDWYAELSAWAQPLGWSVSVQGRKVYVVPESLSKGAAAIRLARTLGLPLIAAGDSILDRDLLEAAEFAVRPAHGELHAIDYGGAKITSRSGARAAEEILALLGEYADGLV